MDELVCNVCSSNYDNDVTVPKFLKCGDTICSNCISSTFHCPACNSSLTSQNSDDYLVNRTILRIVNSLKDGTTGSAFLQHCIVTLKNKYAEIESKFQKNSEKLKSDLKDILLRINELNEDGEASQTILTINKQLEEIRNSSVFTLQNSNSISRTISFNDFKDPVTFLCEIYNRVADGELIYATTKVEEVVRFSRITVWSSKLILHAFDFLEKEDHARTVCKFQEIKKCLNDENCCAFLEICSNERGKRQCLMIHPTNSSLVPQFLELCTGEIGPVYKGASFQKGVDAETIFTIKDNLKEKRTTETNKNSPLNQLSCSTTPFGSSLLTTESSQPSETSFSFSFTPAKLCQPSSLTTVSTLGTQDNSFEENRFCEVNRKVPTQLSFSSSFDNKTLTAATLDDKTTLPLTSEASAQPLPTTNIFGNLKFNFDPPKSATYDFNKVPTTETTKSVIEVKKFLFNGIEDEGNFEYVSSLGSKSAYKANDAFVIGTKNGSFQIFRASRDGYAINVIGTIQEPHEFLENITYGDYSKITDSGIAIELL